MLDVHSIQQHTEILHQKNPYAETLISLRKWAFGDQAFTPYQMVVQPGRGAISEHVTRFNGPTSLLVASIVPGSEYDEGGRRDMVLRRRSQLNANGNEGLDTILVNHRTYDLHCYIFLLPDGSERWYAEHEICERRRNKINPNMLHS